MIRLISGVILASFVLALVFLGTPLHFFVFIFICVVICLYELFGMFERGSAPCLKTLGVVSGAAALAAVYFGDGPRIASVTGVILVAVTAAALYEDGQQALERAANTLFGALFVALPLTSLAFIRAQPEGDALVIMIVAANALCDTFAYYTGRNLGKTPLAPSISPAKTVEGFLGGVVGALVGAIAAQQLLLPELPMVHAAAAGVIAGLIGPVGDLAESSIKRKMGVKDSGGIVPGHGGALDRLDSLMFSSVFFYAYALLVMAP